MSVHKFKKGEVLLSAIIGLGLFLILSQAVITLVASTYDLISYTRARNNAQTLATEHMEIIRNLTYDDVGTQGGIPDGILSQSEEFVLNGLGYLITTTIIYVDDPFDGISPADAVPTDYKRVRVDVSWGGIAASNANTVTLISDIAPPGIETDVGGGTLSILVLNALGLPVDQADVNIRALSVQPAVNLNTQTDSNGRVLLPGAKACNQCYEITITKDGYSTERTYSEAEISNPDKPHVTIVEGQLSEASFIIDQYARFTLNTLSGPENNYASLGNQIINIRGSKIIGTTQFDEPVYKFDQQVVTDSTGSLVIEELEFDTYEVTLPNGSLRTLAAANPLVPLAVLPAEDLSLQFATSPLQANSARIIFVDVAQNPVATVSAILKDTLGFEATQTTGATESVNWGQVFYNDIENKIYTLEATASGYQNYSGSTNVNGNISQTVTLQVQ